MLEQVKQASENGRGPCVAIVIDRYLPVMGGAQQIVHQIAKGLRKKGWCVYVLTRRVAEDLPSYEEIDGIPVYRLGYSRVRMYSKMRCALSVIQHLRRARLDTEVVMAVPTALVSDLLPTWVGARLAGRPYIVRATALNMFDDMLRWSVGDFGALLRKLMVVPPIWRAALRGAEAIIAQSALVAERVSAYGLSNVKTCLAGVDTERFRPASPDVKRELRERLGLPQDALIAINSGRYTNAKNQITFLKAVHVLKQQNPGSQLVALVLGATEQRLASSNEVALKRFVQTSKMEDSVRFYEDVVEVENYLRSSDVFVFPSQFDEGVSNALLEAMACGLAICSSRIPQTCAVVPEELGGFFDPTDHEALAEALMAYEKDRVLCSDLGREVAVYARPRFSLSRVTDTFDRVLKSTGCREGQV